jgi:ATP-dependent RNA helicase DDX27
MAPSFVFETSSDEEDDFQPGNEQHEEEEEGEEEEEDDDDEEEKEEKEKRPSNKKTESPWDFAPYYESVAEEHERRSTTSVDFKISKALQNRSVPIPDPADDSESEPDEHEVSTNLL